MMALWYRLPARQFYLLLIGSVLVLQVGFVSVTAVPQFKRLQKARALAVSTGGEESTAQSLAVELRERDRQAVTLSKRLHGDRANLPAREIEAFVIDRLQRNAWQHDVALQSVVPRAGDAIEQFRELVFELTLTGRYGDLFGWLHQLSADLGFVVIKDLHLTHSDSQSDGANGEPLLRAEVTLASYRREVH